MSTEPADEPIQADVPDELAGMRLDRAAARLFASYSRAQLQKWIAQGRLTMDGACVGQQQAVAAGQTLKLRPGPRYTEAERHEAAEIPLSVVHSDDDLLIINKQVGLVSHPAPGHRNNTLVNALLHLDGRLGDLPRSGLVHRLDKDTSGLLAIARTEAAYQSLTYQLKERTVSRQYLALVRGVPTAGATINQPIGRHRNHRLKMAVREDGRKAVTRFQVRHKYFGYAELEVSLETGRTHQIRVHMSHIGMPLLGDALYRGGEQPAKGISQTLVATIRAFPRQALHAFSLGLEHPTSGTRMDWQCEPPPDYLALREALAADKKE